MAGRTFARTQVFAEPFPDGVGFRFVHPAVHVFEDSLEWFAPAVLSAVHVVVEFERLVAAAVEQNPPDPFRKPFERGGQHIGFVQPLREFAQEQIVVDDQMARSPPPAGNRPVLDRKRRIGHHLGRIHDLLHTESVAGFAGAVRGVEGEVAR